MISTYSVDNQMLHTELADNGVHFTEERDLQIDADIKG
ncbi:hypothetical protein SAMN06265379_101359 [Saccharicrinis carchari]|uniref:Uncharacterized protein n=1 Tax=Saccharicrinis carchari TaxID=1168039 RepID=A0A521ASE9_SACCC|nr:hypothetical protein SAMN06265379_101359 [Saccharicrinis carchari]